MISAFAPTPENAYKITENAGLSIPLSKQGSKQPWLNFCFRCLLLLLRESSDSPPDSLSFPTTSKADESKGPHTPLDEEHHAMIIPGTSRHMLRRRRSHLQRWIEDQHYITQGDSTDIFELSEDLETPIAAVGTPCNPYLAYPHLAVGSFRSSTMDEVGSMHNYVVVDDTVDEDADEDADHVSVDSEGAEVSLLQQLIYTYNLFISSPSTCHHQPLQRSTFSLKNPHPPKYDRLPRSEISIYPSGQRVHHQYPWRPNPQAHETLRGYLFSALRVPVRAQPGATNIPSRRVCLP